MEVKVNGNENGNKNGNETENNVSVKHNNEDNE